MRPLVKQTGLCLGLLTISLVDWQGVKAGSANLTVNLAVITPTCNVTVGTGVTTGNKVDFGNLTVTGVAQEPTGSYAKSFQLNIGSCNVTGGVSGLTPKLKITGTTVTADSSNKIFNNTVSANAGFIVLMNSATAVTWASANANNNEVNLAATSAAAPGNVTIQVGVSKGNLTGTVAAGSLAAAVTFTFRYG